MSWGIARKWSTHMHPAQGDWLDLLPQPEQNLTQNPSAILAILLSSSTTVVSDVRHKGYIAYCSIWVNIRVLNHHRWWFDLVVCVCLRQNVVMSWLEEINPNQTSCGESYMQYCVLPTREYQNLGTMANWWLIAIMINRLIKNSVCTTNTCQATCTCITICYITGNDVIACVLAALLQGAGKRCDCE